MIPPPRPRVLQIGKFYPPHMGGIETHLHALCTELGKSVAIRVIVANDNRRHAEDIVDGVSVARVGRFINISSAPVCPLMVRRIRASAADIVHLHLPNPAAMLAYLMSGHRGRLVVTWHSDIVRQRMMRRALQPFQQRLLWRAAACVATSPNYVESSPALRAHRGQIRVIPYGIPLDRFGRHDCAAIAALRARYGNRIVLSVGRLIYYKGFEYLIRAMREVDGNLLLIGGGPLQPRLEREALALGVRDRVFFLGEIQNHATAPYYHAADVFVLPSIARSEAFGIVQLEAMACGTPVVNTRLESGVPYVSIDGVTGLTVTPCAPAALAAAINRLLGDGALRSSFGAAAARRVRDEFSVEIMARRMLSLYGEILDDDIAVEAAAL
ncbi:MAG: glycosyltransferase [Candidatus Binataceae bacterium]